MTCSEGIHEVSIGQLSGFTEDREKWDKFVLNHSDGLPTHLAGWQEILYHTYRYKTYFLYAQQAGEIQGVLPLFFVNSYLTGRGLQSLPGAICANSDVVSNSLISSAENLAIELKADYLLLHDSRQAWAYGNLETIHAHSGCRIKLSQNPEDVWKKLPKDVRRHIRIAQNTSGITTKIEHANLDDFYSVYLKFTHQIGTPLFGFSFIKMVSETLPCEFQTVISYDGGIPASGFFNFCYGNIFYGMWGATLPDYQNRRITHLAYWAMIEDLCKSGHQVFDMGRAPDPSGSLDFKSQWSDTVYPIYQLYRVYHGRAPAVLSVSRKDTGDGLDLVKRMWKRLPVSIAGYIGPYIRYHMPFG